MTTFVTSEARGLTPAVEGVNVRREENMEESREVVALRVPTFPARTVLLGHEIVEEPFVVI